MTPARFVAGSALLAVGVLAGWIGANKLDRLAVAAVREFPEWTWSG